MTGPSFRFYRYLNGPFSKDLYDAYDFLVDRGFAYRAEPGLTRRGEELAELVAELKRESQNRRFFETLDEVLKSCKRKTGKALLEAVYETIVQPDDSTPAMKVREMPMMTNIIVPPSKASLKVSRDLEDLILEDLEITEEDVQKAAKEELPEMERRFIARLMSASPHSS